MIMEWKEYKLGEVLTEKGYVRGPFGSALRRGDMKETGVPVYEQQHAIYGVRTFRFFVDDEKYNEMKRFSVAPNDLIISCSGTVGEVSIIRETDPIGIISQALLLLRVNREIITPEYLYYFFKTRKGHNSIIERSSGSVQVNISKRNVIEQIPLILPNIDEQNRIVDILSSLDAKIENNNKINAKLEEMAQALFKSWFIDFEPFKDGNFVESELGMIPEGWKVGKLGGIAENITDGVHNTVIDAPNSKYLLLSAKNIKNGKLEISSSERTISKETFAKLRTRTKLSKGDVLLTSVGTIGELYLVNEDPGNIEFQRSVIIIKPGVLLSPYFVYLLLKSQLAELKNMAHGAVQQCIFIGDMKDLKIVIPPVDIIVKFGSVVSTFFDQITKNNKESSNLAQTRDTLLPKLMSGEIEIESINN